MTDAPGRIMTPYYEDDAVTIYHGDCRDLLPLGCDAVITDPPYGTTEADKSKLRKTVDGKFVEFCHEWDRELPLEWIAIAATGLAPGGAGIVFTDTKRVGEVWAAMENAAGMRPLRLVFWHKSNPSPCPRKNFASAVEAAVFARKAGRVLAWNGGAFTHNHWEQPKAPPTNHRHPTEKPLSLFVWLVGLVTEPSHTVLDPFAGSGTTLRAAKDLGRKAIGIEIEEKYCEIAAKRMTQEVLPL